MTIFGVLLEKLFLVTKIYFVPKFSLGKACFLVVRNFNLSLNLGYFSIWCKLDIFSTFEYGLLVYLVRIELSSFWMYLTIPFRYHGLCSNTLLIIYWMI